MLIQAILPRNNSSGLIWSMLSPQVLPLSKSPCLDVTSFSSASGSVHQCLFLRIPTLEREKESGRWGRREICLVSSSHLGFISNKDFLEHPFKEPHLLCLHWHFTLEGLLLDCQLLLEYHHAIVLFHCWISGKYNRTLCTRNTQLIFVEWVNAFLFWITREMSLDFCL